MSHFRFRHSQLELIDLTAKSILSAGSPFRNWIFTKFIDRGLSVRNCGFVYFFVIVILQNKKNVAFKNKRLVQTLSH